MSERFTETLKRESEPLWAQAVEHRFVGELFAGTLANEMGWLPPSRTASQCAKKVVLKATERKGRQPWRKIR